ncbi:putative lysine-specific demethylase JMJ16 isoform X2 [Impatiens glandulifera]|uniref:putative lysine-specific demethylase JMJ16 isoform X2 n=1 Tax=Impatiens glandulifera TaxID=253017 RepID=UPI001FB0C098|nr:putative lysine-specific demethylase JMJ16 isoform X2 [Impatiens glandulifera]
MVTEIFRPCVQEENMDIPSTPPGFELCTVVKPNSLEGKEQTTASPVSEAQSVQSTTKLDLGNNANLSRPVRDRPSVDYSKIDGYVEDVADSKVAAQWHPNEGWRPDLEEVPVFYPSEEEFQDTLNYIESIRLRAEKYGICRIVPPPSWKPPCPLKEKNIWEGSKFHTRIQRVDKLQNRDSLKRTLKVSTTNKRRKKRRCMKMGVECGSSADDVLGSCEAGIYEEPIFGFEPGPEFTLDTFQKYADDFKAQYFRLTDSNAVQVGDIAKVQEQYEPSVGDIEGEYWRIVEKPTEEIKVFYGADLDTGVFGSGFPNLSDRGEGSNSDVKYVKSGWNLNNFPRLPGSVLTYESSDISGVLVPWLYIGMCFSSFCWHVEDHHLYSLNYMHWGASKLWYGVPGQDAIKLEAAMKKHLPQLFQEQPDLLHKLVTQLSPAILRSEGVSVYRCVQNEGEFVLTFPRAYHSGFNCGFNCAEAVNVAPVDWLPHGQNAVELYRGQCRKTSVSHDKLLLGAAREAVKAQWELNLLRKNTSDNLRWKSVCGKNGILTNAFKDRVEKEQVRRGFLFSSPHIMKMESDFDSTTERECSICLFDLHLSAASCPCSPDKYACLNHAHQLCSCSRDIKTFLIRYDINELNILVEALEGKLSAIYRWARLDFGFALSSHVSKGDSQSNTESKEKAGETLNQDKNTGGLCLLQKGGSSSLIYKIKVENMSLNIKKEEISHSTNLVSQPLQGEVSNSNDLVKTTELHKPLFSEIGDVILLSDDDESNGPLPKGAKEKSIAVLGTPSNCIKDPSASCAVKVEQDMDLEPHEDGNISSCNSAVSQSQSQLPDPSFAEASSSVTNSDRLLVKCESEICETTNGVSCSPQAHPFGNELLKNEDSSSSVMGSNSNSRMTCTMPDTNVNQQNNKNNIDRYFRQKGPRIAKVIRRINCNVEILEYGVVQNGKLWCDSRAIFPKGFRSRVMYISALDPTNKCYYVSEILDSGRGSPLFMVSLEESPSDVFVHVSVAKCWDMVREKVNQEITRQHKLGTINLPPLQPPGSLDGFEMFGFSSPAIVQVIQARDKNRISIAYWRSRPLLQIPQHIEQPENDSDGKHISSSEITIGQNDGSNCNFSIAGAVDTVLDGLLKKADLKELHMLKDVVTGSRPSINRQLLTELVREEIKGRLR